MLHWMLDYLDRKWDAVEYNCWCFVVEVYADLKDTNLIAYGNISADDKLQVAKEIKLASTSGDWYEVWIPEEFDIVLMGRNSEPTHVGLWSTADYGRIVHCDETIGVSSMSLKKAQDMGYNLIKFYRHADYSRN